MSTLQDKVAALSSIGLRFATYAFLRWIPVPFLPTIIYTLFAVYIPAFISSFLSQAQYNIVSDDINITVTDYELDGQPPTLPSTAAHSHSLRSNDKPQLTGEDVEIEETIVIAEKSPKFWRTILTGLPSPTSPLLSLTTLLVNVGLVLAATDFLFRPQFFHGSDDLSFARVGYVSDTEAKLLIREPDQSQMPIYVSVRNANPIAAYDNVLGWQSVGGINYLTNETDFTAVLSIPLRSYHETTFEWRTSNNHSGFFTSAPKPGHPSRINDGKFTFVTSSCILHRFPYNPLSHPLSIPGFKHLADVLPTLGAQFMLFLGDFIYADVPRRWGTTVEDYRMKYRQVYASPDWPAVGQNLSWIHVSDDHEIDNDYDSGNTTLYNTAIGPYHHYQTAANPPLAHEAHSFNSVRRDATYFEFTQGPASFFMMDTRTYRDKSDVLPPNSTEKTMLGVQQLADLIDFLERPVPKGVKWKFVISSVPFTKNWAKSPSGLDTWAGYLAERQVILEAMWDVGLRGGVGVVVLSGDRHEFAATAFPPPAGGKWPVSATVNEFSTSPLSQFYLPIRTYKETDEDDIMIKYIPDGISKFGAITIENPNSSDQSLLNFRLYIDGKETWSAILLSPPNQSGKKWGKDALWG